MFELIARQACNISLFKENSNTFLGELSARNQDWIERLQKIDKTTASNLKHERKSRSATLLSSKHPSEQPIKFDGLNTKQNIILPSAYQKPSRGIIMIRRRSCSLQIKDMLARENNGSLVNEWSENSDGMAQDAFKCPENENSKLSGNDREFQLQDRQKAHPKPIFWEDTVCDTKENSLSYEGILRPDPIGRHNDTSPNSLLRRLHQSSSCPNIDLQGRDTWDSLSGIHRPEPIGQEDVMKPPDIRATVILPSSKGGSSEIDDIQRLEKGSKWKRVKKQRREDRKNGSRKRKKKSFKSTYLPCSIRFFRRKIRDLPADVENESRVEEIHENSTSEAEAKRSVTGRSTKRNTLHEKSESEQASVSCNSGLLRTFRQNFAMFRNACSPVINTRTSKVTSAKEEPEEKAGRDCSLSNDMGAKLIPVSYSESFVRESIQMQGSNENMATGEVTSIEDRSPRRHTYDGSERSREESQVGEKRKKVEMWLQRQQCRPLHLRGQIKHITHWNMVLFIGTPMYVYMSYSISPSCSSLDLIHRLIVSYIFIYVYVYTYIHEMSNND